MIINQLEALFFLIVTVKFQQVFCESLIILLLCKLISKEEHMEVHELLKKCVLTEASLKKS